MPPSMVLVSGGAFRSTSSHAAARGVLTNTPRAAGSPEQDKKGKLSSTHGRHRPAHGSRTHWRSAPPRKVAFGKFVASPSRSTPEACRFAAFASEAMKRIIPQLRIYDSAYSLVHTGPSHRVGALMRKASIAGLGHSSFGLLQDRRWLPGLPGSSGYSSAPSNNHGSCSSEALPAARAG